MNIQEFKTKIESAKWFSNLGNYNSSSDEIIALKNLGFCRIRTALEFNLPITNEVRKSEDYDMSVRLANMDWLPTTLSDEDPIYGKALVELAKTRGIDAEFRESGKEIYKTTLQSLRNSRENPLLKIGNSDLNLVARGGVCYATRMTAMEILLNKKGFWTSIAEIFISGNYPVGIMPDKTLVVL